MVCSDETHNMTQEQQTKSFCVLCKILIINVILPEICLFGAKYHNVFFLDI